MDAFNAVWDIIEHAKSFGFRQLESGARLYGHVPHVAPEAWLHQVYAPLSEQGVISVEEKLSLTIPKDLRQFFHLANGIGLFSVAVSIYGKRTSYVRTGDHAWQPFCIVSANTVERPSHAKPSQIVVGGYREDGSLLFLDLEDGSVFRTKSRSKKVLNRCQDFCTMLTDESCRLSGLFDADGHKLSKGLTTLPVEG